MQRVKFIIDSASDIPDEDLTRYEIEMVSIPIAIDGVEYYERKSFTIEQFYRRLAESREIPATSRVPVSVYLESYTKAYEQGYTELINVTINKSGSGTYDSAVFAREELYKRLPEAKKMRIHVVDSRAYAITYGYPVVEAAKMARGGKPVGEILAYLDEWFHCAEIYIGLYSLEYAKKSGRITAATALVGDMLGIRPIISIIDGKTKTVEKIRGDRQIPQRLLDMYRKNCADPTAAVMVVRAAPEEPALQLKGLLDKETGRDIPIYYAGASIVINAGPRMLAIVCKGKRRP